MTRRETWGGRDTQKWDGPDPVTGKDESSQSSHGVEQGVEVGPGDGRKDVYPYSLG